MKLRDAKILFDRLILDAWRIAVRKKHVFGDHPERLFTLVEIRALVQGSGRLLDNNKMPSAQPGSFIWACKDNEDRRCELVVLFEPLDGNPNEMVLVISAYREV